ncbi:uncharacterized protein LOC135392948 [Ornithodoros turicata]|uniref:uncharacterized protein LOC135392948 n=1 Tax=Ornithodoros turicata TaxID=34597 RepID=UPI0031392B02
MRLSGMLWLLSVSSTTQIQEVRCNNTESLLSEASPTTTNAEGSAQEGRHTGKVSAWRNSSWGGFGSLCRKDEDCAFHGGLTCLSAGDRNISRCGCARIVPVVIRDPEGAPKCRTVKLLYERCSDSLECSYNKSNLRCIDYVCQCVQPYRLTGDQLCEYSRRTASLFAVATAVPLLLLLLALAAAYRFHRLSSSSATAATLQGVHKVSKASGLHLPLVSGDHLLQVSYQVEDSEDKSMCQSSPPIPIKEQHMERGSHGSSQRSEAPNYERDQSVESTEMYDSRENEPVLDAHAEELYVGSQYSNINATDEERATRCSSGLLRDITAASVTCEECHTPAELGFKLRQNPEHGVAPCEYPLTRAGTSNIALQKELRKLLENPFVSSSEPFLPSPSTSLYFTSSEATDDTAPTFDINHTALKVLSALHTYEHKGMDRRQVDASNTRSQLALCYRAPSATADELSEELAILGDRTEFSTGPLEAHRQVVATSLSPPLATTAANDPRHNKSRYETSGNRFPDMTPAIMMGNIREPLRFTQSWHTCSCAHDPSRNVLRLNVNRAPTSQEDQNMDHVDSAAAKSASFSNAGRACTQLNQFQDYDIYPMCDTSQQALQFRMIPFSPRIATCSTGPKTVYYNMAQGTPREPAVSDTHRSTNALNDLEESRDGSTSSLQSLKKPRDISSTRSTIKGNKYPKQTPANGERKRHGAGHVSNEKWWNSA